MATTTLSPTPVFKAFDNNGNPLFNGQLFTYAAGTSTPQTTYTDSTGNTANTNPIILNSRGECNLWLNPAQAYKFLLEDSAGNSIWSVDNVTAPVIQIPYATASGTNTITVNTTPSFGTVQDGLLMYFKAANTTTAAATLNANSTGAFNMYYSDGTTLLVAGALIQNNIYAAVFDSSLNSSAGGWIIQNPSSVLGSFTGTLPGATNATGTLNYAILLDGKTVVLTINADITGTSTTTTLTITGIPSILQPATTHYLSFFNTRDAGSQSPGMAQITTASSTWTIGKTLSATSSFPTAYTASGNKGIGVGEYVYPLN